MSEDVLHKLIEDYFLITGRPIATLSVEEYTKFLKAAAVCKLSENGNFAEQTHRSEQSVPTVREPVALHKRHKTPMQSTNQDTNPPDKEAMLKIMRSINS